MTGDGQDGQTTRRAACLGDGSTAEANLATGDRPESVANTERVNWAWANGRSGYDWMDSHFLTIDFL